MTSTSKTRNEWSVKQGDTYGSITEQLLDEHLAPVNVAGASIKFIMKRPTDAQAKVDAAADIVDDETGIVRYSWSGDDLDTEGDYDQEWEVTFASTGNPVLTFPNDGYNVIHVLKELD